MDDRLAELKRQRQLVADHLRWLDAEIARTARATPAGPAPEPAAAATAATGAAAPADASSALLPEHDSQSVKDEVRRGCFLYVVIAAVGLALAGWLLVTLSRATADRDRSPAEPPPVESR